MVDIPTYDPRTPIVDERGRLTPQGQRLMEELLRALREINEALP